MSLSKHHVSDIKCSILLLLAALFPSIAGATSVPKADTIVRSGGPTDRFLHFIDFETALSNSHSPPKQGWERGHVDELIPDALLNPKVRRINLMWGRINFDKNQLGPGPAGLLTEGNREQVIFWLNGTEIFRNYSTGDTRRVEGWYRAYFVELPPKLLREGTNQILIRAESDGVLSVGNVKIGAAAPLQARKNYLQFWRVDANRAANVAMLLLSVAAFAAWLFRRHDRELFYLGLSGVLWFARNYMLFAHYQIYEPPWPIRITNLLGYVAPVASAAFCFHFVKTVNRRAILSGSLLIGILVWLGYAAGLWPLLVLYIADAAFGIIIPFLILFGHGNQRTAEHWSLALLLAFVSMASFHDVLISRKGWDGLGFFLYGYFGVFIAFGFLLIFGRRALTAFTELSTLNRDLELRVAEANQTLLESEEQRRELEVALAVDGERTRLMREMHDGIGSNLVTALAVAEQQQQPPSTIKTLKRAISDLKITVDSLEPVEGDLVALLANLRHRMARDLKEAGLICRWKAEPCPPLPWLDATNALHVLRICQEAIGNALAHSGATQLEIGCAPRKCEGRAGLNAWVADNGRGFTSQEGAGKGLTNMRLRAEALHGVFECSAAPGEGTRIMIWLPLTRIVEGN